MPGVSVTPGMAPSDCAKSKNLEPELNWLRLPRNAPGQLSAVISECGKAVASGQRGMFYASARSVSTENGRSRSRREGGGGFAHRAARSGGMMSWILALQRLSAAHPAGPGGQAPLHEYGTTREQWGQSPSMHAPNAELNPPCAVSRAPNLAEYLTGAHLIDNRAT